MTIVGGNAPARGAARAGASTGTRRPAGRSVGDLIDRLYPPILVLVLVFLAFLAGAFVVFTKAFPYQTLSNAYKAGAAVYEQQTLYDSPFKTDLWQPARSNRAGVVVNDPLRAQNGLTLYTSSHAQKAQLMGMNGEVVHEWSLPFSAVWDETADVKTPRPDEFILWEDVQLFPNGDLIALYAGIGDTPWGYGMVKMDKDSRVIWKYLQRVHHDVDVGPDGRLYTLTHAFRSDPVPSWDTFESPRLEDYAVVLSPDGREEKKVSVLKALLDSPYGRMMWRNQFNPYGDLTHANTIKLITPAMARVLPFARPGQVLLSLREIDALAVLDLETEKVVWAERGSWLAQHDPDVLPNGDLLLFDNAGNYGEGGASRIIQLDPKTREIVWSYAGTEDAPFESHIRAGQQRLANGNTFISESDGGRMIEVAPDGTIVWEFVNPVRGGEDNSMIPVINRAERIDPAALDPAFLNAGP